MDTCIAIRMYCLRLFLLFTGKQHCLYFKKNWGDLPAKNICLHAKFSNFCGVTVLAVQLFNKIKRKKKKKKTKNMKKHVSLYFLDIMSKYIYFC